jgi:hypothetical protein
MLRLAGDESFRSGDHRRDRRLHVRDAAPEQQSIAFGGRERIARPAIERTWRHDVDVSGEADKWCAAAAACPQIPHRRPVDSLARKANVGEPRGKHLQHAAIVGRDRPAGDQPLRQLQRLLLNLF